MRAPQSDQGHAGFLKRNGELISHLIEHAVPAPATEKLALLDELTVLLATGRVYAYLEGRQRRGYRRMFEEATPVQRARWSEADWRYRLRFAATASKEAPRRLVRLHQALAMRHDFPSLDSMREWGHPKWAALMGRLGVDPRLASAVTSLVLDREELPGGPGIAKMYRRLGFGVGPDGRPHRLAIYPQHLRRIKTRLQVLHDATCAKVSHPGPASCAACPLRSFCQSYRDATRPRKEREPTFVDVFAGGGGLSLGLTNAGLHLRLAIENDRHAADTLYLNHPEAPNGVVDARDIRDVIKDRRKLAALRGVDVVAGGPPCQPFSMARRHSKADRNDPRRFLFRSYVELVRKLRPKIVILENVPGIQNAADGDITAAIHQEFKSVGYVMEHRLLNAADHGVPQNRQRFFFIGINRKAFKRPSSVLAGIFAQIEKQIQTRAVTAKEALGGIPRLDPGEGGEVVRKSSHGRVTTYGRAMQDDDSEFLFNHETRGHNPRDLAIFEELAWGETAESLEARRPGTIPYQLDSFGDKYRKIHPHKPAPTIPAHLRRDANSFVHFEVARGITPREAARFQSFPDRYIFLGGFGPAFTQIGNAVPPKLAQVVGEAVRAALAASRRQPRRAAQRRQDRRRPRVPKAPAPPTPPPRAQLVRGRRAPGSRRSWRARRGRGSSVRRSALRKRAKSSRARIRRPRPP